MEAAETALGRSRVGRKVKRIRIWNIHGGVALGKSRVLNSMKKDKECPIKRIQNEEGQVLTESKDIMMKWKEHFRDLLEEQDDAKGVGVEAEAHSAVCVKEEPPKSNNERIFHGS
ncbi:hypothetical protein ILUMI_16847 [Ignelater luminosus]|uniref:Uncharacterized protein n=1 Tax=Ignelater luminosus TaxID=2038154 RepID=A0A8K0CPG4_IGNLU|nr:hypothetical protein ILUMI_16847 [Ignelater luminosus]